MFISDVWRFEKAWCISTGDFQEVLSSLLGKNASVLLPTTISQMKVDWIKEHESWFHRDISKKKNVS